MFVVICQGGVLGYKRDGGGLTEPNVLHPKKYKTGNFRPSYMQIIRIMLSDLAGTLA